MGLFASNDCVGTPPMYHSPNERFIECILSVNGLKLPESPADGYSALVGMGLHMGEKSTRVEVDYLLYNLYFEVVAKVEQRESLSVSVSFGLSVPT
jgi:hypothetical protein